MASNRDEFSKSVVDVLCRRAAFICSNPNCHASTLAPSSTEEGKYLYIGKAAHICAAAVGGPRYRQEMSSEERRSISNGIFLCSNCADLIDRNSGEDYTVKCLEGWKSEHDEWVAENLNKRPGGEGGEGGSGTIYGERGTVIGGRGGAGGISGVGGKGGGGTVVGDDALIIGGDGGNCPTADGRGGKVALSPMDRYGSPSEFWGYGRGGSSPNHPEYNRRITLLKEIRSEYLRKFPNDATYINAGVDHVPVEWINQRLSEMSEIWRVSYERGGYVLPALPKLEDS